MHQQNLQIATTNSNNRFLGYRASSFNKDEQNTVIALALELLEIRNLPGTQLSSPDNCIEFLRLLLGEEKNEIFGVIHLDSRMRVLHTEHLFTGTVDGASVFPRVVVQRVLEVGSADLIFFHNHPSGEVTPSQADKCITARLVEALKLIDVRVSDHFIVTSEGSYSFSANGLI